MGLKDKLIQQGSNLSDYDGATPPAMPGAASNSRLHYQYSINGVPFINGKPNPSVLDLDGVTPPKYTDNLPG